MTEQKITLYEIADALRDLETMVEEDQDLIPYLDGVVMEFHEKVNNIVKYMRHLELTSGAIDLELKRLSDLKKHFTTHRDRLEAYIKYSMERHDLIKVDTGLSRLSFRKATSVFIEDQDAIPDQYLLTKTIVTPDKLAIKTAIESGDEVPGAKLLELRHLQIK